MHAARAQTPEVADGANPSPHATTAKSTGQGTPEGNTPGTYPLAEGDAPRKRASRASKNAAMASWKANKMLDEDDDADDDSRSEDGTRQSRRSKKVHQPLVCLIVPSAGGVLCSGQQWFILSVILCNLRHSMWFRMMLSL